MFTKLLLAFILIPLADLVLLWILFTQANFAYSVAIILISGFLGAYLAKMQGRRVLMEIRKDLQDNLVPAATLINGAIILFAGGLLITPGLITDIMGFSLLFPFTREILRKKLVHYLKGKFHVQTYNFQTSFHSQEDDGTVEGEVVRPEKETRQVEPEMLKGPSKD